MLSYVVAKPFNTLTQRLRVGDPVAETDDVAPHDFAVLKHRRWIVSEATKAGEKAVEQAEDRTEQEAAEAAAAAEPPEPHARPPGRRR